MQDHFTKIYFQQLRGKEFYFFPFFILNKKISVSENRKKCHKIQINKNEYKVYPVNYAVGNGIFNIDKSIEDIKWIIENEIKKEEPNLLREILQKVVILR